MAIADQEKLQQHYLFSSLNTEQFQRLWLGVQKISLTENDFLFHFGDTARYFYFVESGQIMLYRLSASGEEKVIEIIQAGQTFAEAVMFFHINCYPVSAKAVLKSELFRIDMKIFLSLLQASNDLCLNLLGGMSKRLHSAISDIEQLTLQNAKMRVIELLLQSAPSADLSHYVLEWETPKQILASRLSVRPETFSRVLQQLSRKGLISVQGKQVEIVDVKSLQAELLVE